MSNLDQLINELYQNNLAEGECKKSSELLVSFFQELEKIDKRLQQKK